MKSRRKFLKGALATGASLGLISGSAATTKASSLDFVDQQLTDGEFWQQVRMQFALKEGQTYFNNGTVGPVPIYTMNRMIDHMRYNAIYGAETNYKDEDPGPQLLTGYFKYEPLRKKVAALVNADFREIMLIQNATFGMNYVAHGLDLKKGDEIINTDQEHGGGYAAWQLMAKRKGCVYKQAKMPIPANDPQEIIDSIFGQVTKKTKVIAVPHIISVYGVVMPVKEICAEAKKRGIFTILDGAQTVGQIKVDLQEIGCDAYYSSLHKWLLAPAGNGILYINKEKIKDIWTTIASYNWENEEDHGFRIMQNGTGNTALLEGLDASIDFYNSIGPDRWIGRIKELGDRLRNGIKDLDNIEIHSSVHAEMCAGMTTYKANGISGPDLQLKMWTEQKLQPRSVGEELVRHSVHIYNNEDEIDRSIELLKSV